MVNQDASQKFVKQGLTFDDVTFPSQYYALSVTE